VNLVVEEKEEVEVVEEEMEDEVAEDLITISFSP